MPALRALLATLLAAFLLVVAAPPSSAASEDIRDPGRDVLSGSYFSDDLPTRPEPARRAGDIVSTKVTFGTDLVVTTKFRSLTAGLIEQEYQWLIATSEDDFPWWADLMVPQGSRNEEFFLIDPVANQPACGKADLDRSARKVTLTIPADCLGNPDWVRIANGVVFYVEAKRTYYDDARRDATVGREWKFGRKVLAG